MNLPTLQQIERLHRKQAKSHTACHLIYTHCTIVAEIAEQIIIAKNLAIDLPFIRLASLIHDIGAYAFIAEDGTIDKANYIRHGIVGAKILHEEGFDEAFCRIAERHTGVGLYQEDILKDNLPLPVKDYVAETLEEKLVMYADKFHSKDPCFHSFSWYCRYIGRFGDKKVVAFKQLAEEFGIPDLAHLIHKYNMPINE